VAVAAIFTNSAQGGSDYLSVLKAFGARLRAFTTIAFASWRVHSHDRRRRDAAIPPPQASTLRGYGNTPAARTTHPTSGEPKSQEEPQDLLADEPQYSLPAKAGRRRPVAAATVAPLGGALPADAATALVIARGSRKVRAIHRYHRAKLLPSDGSGRTLGTSLFAGAGPHLLSRSGWSPTATRPTLELKRLRVRDRRTVSQPLAVERAHSAVQTSAQHKLEPPVTATHIPTTPGKWRSVVADSSPIPSRSRRCMVRSFGDLPMCAGPGSKGLGGGCE
jgi:hypothetical protein